MRARALRAPVFKLNFTQNGALRPPPAPAASLSSPPPPKKKLTIFTCPGFEHVPARLMGSPEFFIYSLGSNLGSLPPSAHRTCIASYHWCDEYYYYKFIVYTKLLDSPKWQFREQIRQTPQAHTLPPPPEDTKLIKCFKIIGGLLCILTSSGLAIIRPFIKLIAKIVLSTLQTYN